MGGAWVCNVVRTLLFDSIYGIYIAPLQGNYSEAGPDEKKGIKEFVEGTGQIPW